MRSAEIASLRQRIKQQSNTAHGSEEEAILSQLRLKRKREPASGTLAAEEPTTASNARLLEPHRKARLEALELRYCELCQVPTSTCFRMLQSELKINAHELQLLGEAESLVFGGLDKLNASFPRRKPTVTARAFREDGHKFLRVIKQVTAPS